MLAALVVLLMPVLLAAALWIYTAVYDVHFHDTYLRIGGSTVIPFQPAVDEDE
jgi:hypothetical protein